MPKYLDEMLKNITNGGTVRGKRSDYSNAADKKSLEISKEEDRFVKVVHFGTTILDLDFWGETPEEKVTYVKITSKTDAMIIHEVLSHYNLSKDLRAGYGPVTGPTFTNRETGEDVYEKWQ